MSDCLGHEQDVLRKHGRPGGAYAKFIGKTNPDHAIGPTKLVKPPQTAACLLSDFLDRLDLALIHREHGEDEARGLLRVYRMLSMELANLEAEQP